jgi:ATP-dependent DNA helicase RecG
MNKIELLKRLTNIEWGDFEIKEARSELPKNIWETVSAFVNSSGGWVVLGVSQTGKNLKYAELKNQRKWKCSKELAIIEPAIGAY